MSGGRPEWEMDIKEYSDLILKAVGTGRFARDLRRGRAIYDESQAHGLLKSGQGSQAQSRITPEEGIKRTVAVDETILSDTGMI